MTASLSHSPSTRCGTAALKHNTMKGSSGPILAQQSGESSKVTGIVVKKKNTHTNHTIKTSPSPALARLQGQTWEMLL